MDQAGFDVIMVEGHPFLLEFNVLFGNEALNQAGIDTAPMILDHLQTDLAQLAVPSRAA